MKISVTAAAVDRLTRDERHVLVRAIAAAALANALIDDPGGAADTPLKVRPTRAQKAPSNGVS